MVYDIKQFEWSKKANAFFGDVWNLVISNDDGTIIDETYPDIQKGFTIKNYETDGSRDFKFVELIENYAEDTKEIIETDLLFQSEDGIKCYIAI